MAAHALAPIPIVTLDALQNASPLAPTLEQEAALYPNNYHVTLTLSSGQIIGGAIFNKKYWAAYCYADQLYLDMLHDESFHRTFTGCKYDITVHLPRGVVQYANNESTSIRWDYHYSNSQNNIVAVLNEVSRVWKLLSNNPIPNIICECCS